MSDEPDNIVLVYLRRIDNRIERLEDDMRDVKFRITGLEQSYSGIQLRLDRVDHRLDRIERRLDLHDARA